MAMPTWSTGPLGVEHAVVSRPSHVDLLALSRSLRQAAVTGDVAAVHHELSRLRRAFVHHVLAEEGELAHLPETAAHVARQGQQRILAVLEDLQSGHDDHGGRGGSCGCVVRVAELELALRRQAKLEAAVVSDVAAAGRRPSPPAASSAERS